MKKYLLVMEYADANSLQNYLKENFKKLTWEDKYKLSYQLICGISYLHDEEIIHRNLVIYLELFIIQNLLIFAHVLLYFIYNSTLTMF